MSEPEILTIMPGFERLDAAAAPDFKLKVDEQVEPGQTRVLLDLSHVAFIDSTGLGVLVSLLKKMGPGGRIAVIGVAPQVERLFQITRLDSLFKICGEREEAQDVLAG